MAEQPTAEPAAPPRRGRLRLIIVVAVVLLAGGGAFMVLGGGGGDDAAAAEPTAPAEGIVTEVAVLTTSVPGAASAYVRVGFAAVLAEGVTEEAVADRYPLLKDAALQAISRSSEPELRSPEGQDALRGALTAAAAEVYPDGEVLRIVLTELLVQ